jgi:PAS domain S-box-containing protein
VADGLVVHHPETGEIVDANERFCDMNGYAREELLGESIGTVTADDDTYSAAAALENVRRARVSGTQLFEWRNQRKDGETYPVEVHLQLATVHGEEYVLASVREITERKRREREYEEVFHGVNDGIVIQDPETAEPLDANRTFLDRLGYDDVEEIREAFDELSATGAGFTKERAQELCRRVMEDGGSETVEWQQETKSGERRWIEATVDTAEIRGEERIVSMQRDVTERKRRQQEYEQIFHGVNDVITVHDPETAELVDANDTFCELLGYDREEILEMGIEGYSPTDAGYTMDAAREFVREVVEADEPRETEWAVETCDGETRWLSVTGTTVEIGGEPRYVSINRDVTERRRREREYEQIFNGVNDIVNVYDPETGDLVAVNDTMCELTGYDRETLLDRGLDAVTATDAGFTGERAERLIDDVMADGETRELEWRLESVDGEQLWLDVKATPATINGEDRLLTISRDVTERRRTERRLEAILDRIDEAILFLRAADLDTARSAPDYVSSGYEEIWGQPLDEMHTRHEDGFFDTLHPEDRDDYRAFLDEMLRAVAAGEDDDRYSREYRIRRPSGEVRWVHSDYYPVRWGDEPARMVVVSRDVTDRKARERRMASFDEATDGLATADTPADATRAAVEAARETLDLSAVGAFLYDEDDGVLRPEVLSGPLAPVGDDTGSRGTDAPVGPGDGPLWEAFATGTVVAPDGGERDPHPGLGDLTAWRGLALGSHGLLLVGSPDGTLDDETIQAAHVLAATLEAALNHLDGRRQLEDREEQLRTQTERAERLDRIARLTQRIEEAITGASAPREIERAVCERLADTGPYDLAWIGGVDVGVDRISARSVVGAPESYVADLGLTTADDGPDAHPAVRAWGTDGVQVTDSIVGGGPTGGWRQRPLTEGYQSLCAVPLVYDGVTHGVLTVGATVPDAFGERERAVLEQLGVSIANALAAVERRRALESDETLELEFAGPGTDLPLAAAARRAGCRVRHERTAAREDGSVSVSFRFEGDVPDDVGAVASETLPGETTVVNETDAATLVAVRTNEWFGSPLAEYGAVLREATASPDGTTLTVELPERAEVRSFVDRLGTVAPSLELAAKRHHRTRNHTPAELSDRIAAALTDRQLEAVRTALSAGYFEWPRESDGGDVADMLGITQPTFNKHLRVAERQTFELLFDGEE